VKVLIVESGGLDEEAEIDELSQFENIGAPRHMVPTRVRNRTFGGSSHTWSGRCTALDDIDYERRPWVPFSGWPIGPADLDRYLDRAAPEVGIVPRYYGDRFWSLVGQSPPNPDVDGELLKPYFWQFSSDDAAPQQAVHFGRRFISSAASNIRVLLHASVTHITTDDYGSQLKTIEATSLEGKRATIKSKVLILCAGGIENARLLLCSNRIVPEGVGNKNGLVGRFLMDHPRCEICEFDREICEFDIKRVQQILDRYGVYRPFGGGQHFRQGLALSASVQRKMELLNCVATIGLEDRYSDDPWDAVRRLRHSPEKRPLGDKMKDMWCIASQPGLIVEGLQNKLLHGKAPPFKVQRLAFYCDVEQRPDPESRISLSERKDRFGLPLPKIDWRIGEQEKLTVATLATLITQEFPRVGLPELTLAEWIRTGCHDQASFLDAAHPSGTTRMASDAREGVVDENCQIHDVDGIYIAGSSVFPTVGHANPTLMIVALALRLADRLKTNVFHSAASPRAIAESPSGPSLS
jgi:choline dehydrogenase-like flavoprotein